MILILLVGLLSFAPLPQEALLSVCRVDYDWPRYEFSPITPDSPAYYFADGASWNEAAQTLTLDGLQFWSENLPLQVGEALVGIFDGTDYIEIWGTPDTPLCNTAESGTQVRSLQIPASGYCAYAEIEDEFGSWHLITQPGSSEGICWPIVNGHVELIIVDPNANYRVKTDIVE